MVIDVLVPVVILLGLGVWISNGIAVLLIPKQEVWRWTKFATGIVGLLWVLLYTGIVIGVLDNSTDPLHFSAKVVRPLIALTLGSTLASSLMTIRRYWNLRRSENKDISLKQFILSLVRGHL